LLFDRLGVEKERREEERKREREKERERERERKGESYTEGMLLKFIRVRNDG
jgi:hypothetical protein